MNGGRTQGDAQIAVSVIAALLVHALLVGGVGAAAHFGWGKEKPRPRAVEMEILPPPPKVDPPPPPRVEPEPEPEPEPPPPPPPVPEKTPPRREKAPPPPPTPAPPVPEPPAPGPPSPEAPPEAYTYTLPSAAPGGTMAVPQGPASTGSGRGVKGGTGTGTGGGGPPDSKGTGPVVSAASVKREPIPLGEFDYEKLQRDEYPANARRLGIEGPVRMKLLVSAQGRVVQTELIKGLGHGLDEKAVQLAKKLKFKPAIDTNDQPVAMWLTWTFNFIVPE